MIRLGDFWNLLGTNFITNIVQMFGYFLGSCENHHFLCQTCEAIFGATFVKLRLLFISTSGHNGQQVCVKWKIPIMVLVVVTSQRLRARIQCDQIWRNSRATCWAFIQHLEFLTCCSKNVTPFLGSRWGAIHSEFQHFSQ